MGPGGGNATILATEAEGVPFRFLNDLDIDQATQVVYFTDTSAKFARRYSPVSLFTALIQKRQVPRLPGYVLC